MLLLLPSLFHLFDTASQHQTPPASDSPLVWSSCHHQNASHITPLLEILPDLLVPSGYLFFPVPDLFYLRTACHTLVSGTPYPTASVCLHCCPTFLSLTLSLGTPARSVLSSAMLRVTQAYIALHTMYLLVLMIFPAQLNLLGGRDHMSIAYHCILST